MGLKQDVVVVSEFSVPQPNGKGSRGGTPGAYVERYMARELATESLAPIQRQRTDDFILRYMARESAVEAAPTRVVAKQKMAAAQGQGGVAFGYGAVSLSDEQLKAASGDIQRLFDVGHTVIKTVISFDEEYLRKHGIIDPDFHCERRGDYRSHIDQMKLRMAIMHGLERMGHDFDDLRYVGVIQVDTEHVHCHLAMVDAGVGTVMPDGTQRGKLTSKQLSRMRRGIEAWLDEKQAVAQLSSAVGYERRNVVTFIKRWAHERMQAESLPQFLLACLPADRDLWRAGSNHAAMRKPNRIVRELVLEQLERAGSPLPAAMEQVTAYANTRREVEDLTTEEWQRLVEHGREQILERAMNGVYQMLRSLPEDELWIRTPMLEVMGMDYEQLALAAGQAAPEEGGASQELVSFGFRLRSYASRLEHHTERREAYRDLARRWEELAERVSPEAMAASRPLYDFYRFEEEYHAQAMSKYRHFLPFIGDKARWYRSQQKVAEYGQRMLSLIAMRGDASLQRMKDEAQAEQVGQTVYHQPGGRLLTQGAAGRAVLDERIAKMRASYARRLEDLGVELSEAGLVLMVETPQAPDRADRAADRVVGRESADAAPADEEAAALDQIAAGEMRIEEGTAHDFEQVKAVDLHHLGYDFAADVEIGPRAKRGFIALANQRRRLLIGAMEYLDASGQEAAISDLPVEDVASMVRLAEQLDSPAATTLPSRLARLRQAQADKVALARSRASSLDAELSLRVQRSVESAVLASVASADDGASRPEQLTEDAGRERE